MINSNIDWAQAQDISTLSTFLTSDISRPLICIGSGGAITACNYASLLHNVTGGFAQAFTPYSAYSLSDNTIRQSKILLISHSGHNHDIINIAKRCAALNPEYTANLTTSDSSRNDVKKYIKAENSFNYKSDFADGFISVNSTEATMVLLCRAYKSDASIPVKFEAITPTFDFKSIEHFIILHGSWGQPVAIDIESKLVESGIATAAVSDYRNFCHGRFIFPCNHSGHPSKSSVTDNCVVVLLVTPREKNIADRIRGFLPENIKSINLTTDIDGAEASIGLLYLGWNIVQKAGFDKNVNPLSPPNISGVDKRRPQQIPFISDIKKSGTLRL